MKRIAILSSLLAFRLFAQVDTGSIVGTLHDPSGAAVPSATVTIVEQATNTSTVVHSDANGEYASPPLHVGTYSVTAEAPGFKAVTRENLTLQVQDRLRIDFNMEVGQISQKVLVSSELPPIQTETSSLGQVLPSRVITELPLNGRDYIQLATLTTGVVNTSATNTNGNIGGSSTGGQNSFVADGARGTLNNFLLDGIDNNSNDNGGVVLRTNVDAIQEFKIQTNSFSAEFGRSGGAAINAVIKSGTNSYHGDVFEFFRNSALDARNYFEDPTAKKASFKQNQFGATIGGPIRRDKLFWFGDYQGTVIRNPLTFVSSVPTAAERTGNFSDLGTTIYDPATYNPATNTRMPFLGNIIPPGRISTLAQNIMNLYPLPNQPGKLKNNYIISPTEQDRIDQGDFRTDYNISETNQLFFRWSMSGRTDVRPAPLPGLGQRRRIQHR